MTTSRAAYLGPERRRPLVVDAGIQAFAERGFLATSMNDVAARAAVSKGVLYDCFPGGKEDLFHACVDQAGARLAVARAAWVKAYAAGLGPADLVMMLADVAATDPASFALLISPKTPGEAPALVSLLESDLRLEGVLGASDDAMRTRLRIACLVALSGPLAGAQADDVAAILYGELRLTGDAPREEPAWSEAVAG